VIVADASWIIALRDPKDVHHEAAADSNRKLGDEEALLPAVTFAECLVGPAKLGLLDKAARDLRAAFEIQEADGDAPMRWASLRASTGLRLRDVIVLDAVLYRGARGIATFDDRLAACSADKGLEVIGLNTIS
jgi:predicted nucleic acid-binding protein